MSDSYNITSANSVVTLAVASIYPSGFQLENFAADRMFETEALEIAETQMSADGYLNAGFIFNPVDQTYTFSPASDECTNFETVLSYSRANKTVYRWSGTILVPATGRKYTLTNGVLMRGSAAPNAARTLEPRQFTVRWGQVAAAAYVSGS